MSDSLQPYGPQPARILCPWESPAMNTGVGCHALLQGIFSIQESNPCLLCLLLWQADSVPAAPICINIYINIYYSSDALLSEAVRDAECDSPCPAAVPCCLSPLCVAVCARWPHIPGLSPPTLLFPLLTLSLFSFFDDHSIYLHIHACLIRLC